MILIIYSTLIAFLTPFLYFILPIIANALHYNYHIPIEIVINFIIIIIITGLNFGFYLHNTSNACNQTNIIGALLNSIKFFIILLSWICMLDYYPSIIEPFYNVFKFNGEIASIIYKSIMIYGVIFLLLTYTNFKSIKDTCKASLKQIKEAYTILQSEINK
jgi:hypothetical protein